MGLPGKRTWITWIFRHSYVARPTEQGGAACGGVFCVRVGRGVFSLSGGRKGSEWPCRAARLLCQNFATVLVSPQLMGTAAHLNAVRTVLLWRFWVWVERSETLS